MTRLTKPYSEDAMVEQPAIQLFAELSWETANCFYEFKSGESTLGRETQGDVVLVTRLRPALEKLNPGIPAEGIDQAVEELLQGRGAMSPAEANRQVYTLIKRGARVMVPDPAGGEKVEVVRFIDWSNPGENDFFLASQFWVTGELYTRRADLVGFVNGIPLVFIELKASHKNLEDAYRKNLADYRDTIPHLFWYNNLLILSNGSKSKVGSVTAGWEHFADWKRINSEGEEGVVSLETMIRGTCEKVWLLDLVENFTLFQEVRGGLIKILAKNHQYLGVNNAIQAVQRIKENQGRLGVFWHTQGSGKTVSMIFFSQKILRTLLGNWTFVVVTDRDDLDDQAYKEFSSSGVVTEEHAQATSSANLRQLLTEDHRYVFTLIHKFRTEKGKKHPVLSRRKDVIVIADEAHRTQYDTLALNMRNALPEAAFIAFTGTPLIAGEEKTRDTFGDYVSVYNFKQSVDDKATVPLFYENRIPELQVTNQRLNEDIYLAIEDAELDEEQEKKVEREFAREYHLITRDERLERIAGDVVSHFMGRGNRGKAMVISIDKATAVRMYDKVRAHWQKHLKELKTKLKAAKGEERESIAKDVAFMKETDMAVVVSQAQGEIEHMRKKGLEIKPHRKRIVEEDLDEKFKDPDDPLRLVFVCAMWMTGFDVPSCSTLYVDKPMRNHTLMQTIARANRVFPGKESGVIVDYVGVFRNLEKALAIYGPASCGGVSEGDNPIKEKQALVEMLKRAIEDAKAFSLERGLDLNELLVRFQEATGFDRVKLLDDAVELLLGTDEIKRRFRLLAGKVVTIYKAILPDPAANELGPVCVLLGVLLEKMRPAAHEVDISQVMQTVEDILDRSIATEGYVIREPTPGYDLVDLSQIDFDALRKKFEKGRKRIEAERLRGMINQKLRKMVQLNRTRMDYLEKFLQLVEEYNSGSVNLEEFFHRLVAFAQELTVEEQRSVKETLSEEELAVFDLLTRPDIHLDDRETKQVKKVARVLLKTLKRRRLVLDWRKRQQSRAAVKVAIEEVLDALPDRFTSSIYQEKCSLVYQHVFESYSGQGRSIYEAA